ncbi:SCO family protein [Nonlabens tegetincola]|uniref:SCO family protein n=1 Tax=Nonlabens tegetincola TaxID=323273 RepID=UPI000A206F8A|nr:SCO family protein [Nonlabens tegetincola]ARN72063.1 SCO family protein [Nonlabens tegetincola]
MSKKKDTPYYIGLAIIIVIFGYFAVKNVVHYINKDKVVDSNRTEDRAPVADKFLYRHGKIPDFKFVNQRGDTITNETLLGQVYIVDFFFTSCGLICPPMSKNMATVHDELKEYKNFKAISITIDPITDTPKVMKEYAARYTDDTRNWWFLHGEIDDVFELAEKGFSSYIKKSDDPAIRFEHSGNFALVDKEGFLRSRKDEYGNWIMVYRGVEEFDAPPQIDEIVEDAVTLLND